jgi:outer membrane protein TolC
MICHGWRCVCWIAALSVLLLGCKSGVRDESPDTFAAQPIRGTDRQWVEVAPPLDQLPRHVAAAPARLPPPPPSLQYAPTGTALPLRAVAYQQREEAQLPVPGPDLVDLPRPEVLRPPDPLELRDVIASVQQSYPLLISIMQERVIAAGKQLTSRGEFDLLAKGFGIAAPEGFYQNYRNGIALDQPLFHGGYLYGGYKIGDGKFQPWFKERETNEGGEFSLGFGTPLLKDRAIDKRRAELFQADLARQAVEPVIRAELLEFVRVATQVYWGWVAAGQSLLAQRELLQNAQDRVKQIETRVIEGDLAPIARINNDQLIAARETKVIEAERKLQESAIKLSLFYRNPRGAPVIPDNSRLPSDFPPAQSPDREMIDSDIARALDASPLLAELELVAEQVRVELSNAENMMLPKLDARALASKDIGAEASPTGDKTPFELEAGLFGELPLQRRGARGKIDAAQGKLAQINAKRRFVVDKTVAAVQDAYSALLAAAGRIERANANLRLARRTLELGRIQFDAGDIDLVDLNIFEKAATDAQLLLITAEADFFVAMANYRAILAIDPLMGQ